MSVTNKAIRERARRKLLGHWGDHCAFAVLLLMLEMAAMWLGDLFRGAEGGMALFLSIAVTVVLRVLLVPFYAGASLHFLKVLRDEPSSLADFIEPLKSQADRFLVVGLVEAAGGTVFFLPFLAGSRLAGTNPAAFWGFSLLWLIAGGAAYLIFRAAFAQAVFLLLDDPSLDGPSALRMSAERMRGKKKRFVLLILSFAGFGLLCLPTFGLGLVWVLPYFLTSAASFYEALR